MKCQHRWTQSSIQYSSTWSKIDLKTTTDLIALCTFALKIPRFWRSSTQWNYWQGKWAKKSVSLKTLSLLIYCSSLYKHHSLYQHPIQPLLRFTVRNSNQPFQYYPYCPSHHQQLCLYTHCSSQWQAFWLSTIKVNTKQ